MKEKIIEIGPLTLMGVSARTRNTAEMDGTGEIPKLWSRFYQDEVLNRISGLVTPGEIMVAYTDFESDDSGPYTIVIGAAVKPGTQAPDDMVIRKVARGSYLRVPTSRGKLAEIGVATWMKIWQDQPLRERRTFRTDLEIYGKDAANPENAQFEIFLGVK